MEFSIWEEMRSKLALSDLGKPALVGLAAIVVMVAVLAGQQIIDTATATEVEIERAQVEEQAPMPAEPESVFVHVSGAVAQPGLYELPDTSRVGDAVEAAGGFAEDALADSVNLARILQDGEQVHVASASESGLSVTGGAGAVGVSAQPGARTNINTAGVDELQALPGIGESTARKIVADRDANGPFSSTEDLKRVSGIGDKKFEALADCICV